MNQADSATSVTIIGGYLGSGKTTLVNHVLRNCGNTPVAVLVNDFGELAIDAALIETEEGSIISLSGGCVCCSYGNDLSLALLDVLALPQKPAHIVIEASGVALPAALAASLTLMPKLRLHGIIVMCNAETIRTQAADRYMSDTITRQLSSADVLVVNRIDLVDDNSLQSTEHWLRERWPTTSQIKVSEAQIPVNILLDDSSLAMLEPSADDESVSNSDIASDTGVSSFTSHFSSFTTFTLAVTAGMDIQALAELLASDRCELLRAKGFIIDRCGQLKVLQIVGRRWHIADAPSAVDSEASGHIVCIGLAGQVNHDNVKKLSAQLQSNS